MAADLEPFAVRGAIEGFYGTYYTFPERNDLIRFLGKHDFNYYLYAPKNDRQHRARWWEPYPPSVMEQFAQTIRISRHAGVAFCYGISFGTPIDFSAESDVSAVMMKLETFLDLGCRSFAILFDDSPTYYSVGGNRENFRSPAHAHFDFSNRVLERVRSRAEAGSLYVCPTDYCGVAPFSRYLQELGHGLHPDIKLFYTGPAVCSPSIGLEDVVGVCRATGRPPMLWDNYPVNDLGMRAQLHLGPLLGRDERLAECCAGYAANLMNEAEASKIPLATIAEYLKSPHKYAPSSAWERGMAEVGGTESLAALRRFARTSLRSCLDDEEAPELDRLASAAVRAIEGGGQVANESAVVALRHYLEQLDEACYALKNRMANLALRQNLLPWIEALDDKVWLGRFALDALLARQTGEDIRPARKRLREQLRQVKRSSKRIGGDAVVALGNRAARRLRESEEEPLRDSGATGHPAEWA